MPKNLHLLFRETSSQNNLFFSWEWVAALWRSAKASDLSVRGTVGMPETDGFYYG
jgi:hypothetical protein